MLVMSRVSLTLAFSAFFEIFSDLTRSFLSDPPDDSLAASFFELLSEFLFPEDFLSAAGSAV